MITNIAVGVTTAPRAQVTLKDSLDSLIANRWKPHVFAEPDSDLSGVMFGLPLHKNSYQLGAWHNWLHCCRTLLAVTDCEYILTVQDDTVVVPGAAEFLQTIHWPEKCGMMSLYTPTQYSQDSPGLHRIHTQSLWGACAMLFRRDHLEAMLTSSLAHTWLGAKAHAAKPNRRPCDVANVDTAVGQMVDALKLSPFFFTPSLSQHIGVTSTLGNKDMGPKRVAAKVVNDFSVFTGPAQ